MSSDLIRDGDGHDMSADPPQRGSQEADTVFAVLAQRASERSSAELWTTAVVGSINATFVLVQHPNLHWLGAGFAAAAAYGIWGLANRAIVTQNTRLTPLKRDLLRGLRGAMVPIGVVSVIAAVGSFMAVSLGGWIH